MIEKEQIELMEQRIQKFNEFVMSQDIDKMPVGLFSGKMGLCIYFFHQGQITQNKNYKKFAERLLNTIFSQLNNKTLTNLEDGLIGICLGLNYLIDNGFQSGNINHILSELDDKIYKAAWFDLLKKNSMSIESAKYALDYALYFVFRLQNKKINKNNRFLFELIVIELINQIDYSRDLLDIYSEPSVYTLNQYLIVNYLYVLTMVHKLGFYSYKTTKIFDEIYPKLASTYPLLQSNRLQLLSVLELLNKDIRRSSYASYISRLQQEIDIKHIINHEFKNRSLFLINGVCGMYFIQNILFKNTQILEPLIIEKIIYSELWSDFYKNEKIVNMPDGLFTGFAGIIAIYVNIINKI